MGCYNVVLVVLVSRIEWFGYCYGGVWWLDFGGFGWILGFGVGFDSLACVGGWLYWGWVLWLVVLGLWFSDFNILPIGSWFDVV